MTVAEIMNIIALDGLHAKNFETLVPEMLRAICKDEHVDAMEEFVKFHFGDQMHDTPVKWTTPLEHQASPNDLPLRKFAADLTETLKDLIRKYGA